MTTDLDARVRAVAQADARLGHLWPHETHANEHTLFVLRYDALRAFDAAQAVDQRGIAGFGIGVDPIAAYDLKQAPAGTRDQPSPADGLLEAIDRIKDSHSATNTTYAVDHEAGTVRQVEPWTSQKGWQSIENVGCEQPIWVLKYDMYSKDGHLCGPNDGGEKFTSCHGWYATESDALMVMRHFPHSDKYKIEKVYRRTLKSLPQSERQVDPPIADWSPAAVAARRIIDALLSGIGGPLEKFLTDCVGRAIDQALAIERVDRAASKDTPS